MKKLLSIFAISISSIILAQFNIEGEIIGYENQPLHIKVYEDGNLRLLKRLETDKSGKFAYQLPMAYKGIVHVELTNASFEILSDNNNITFSTNLDDEYQNFNYAGGINQTFKTYQDVIFIEGLRDNTLVPLLNYYKVDQRFYQNLQAEIRRINQLEKPEIKDENLNYYIHMKKEIQDLSSSESTDLNAQANRAKDHLVNDDENLENFGFLSPLISIYISNSLGSAKSREEANQKIGEALDSLLAEVVPETPRGQNILSQVIGMLDGNGFGDLADKYVQQVDSMTCELTGDLKTLLEAQNNIKVGKKAPNFKLDVKNYTSLYDVKANEKLLIFWASWCPHCVQEMPFVQEFYKDFKSKGGEIVAVSLDMDENKYKQAIKNFGWINYSDLLKWDSPIVQQYGVNATPTMLLLDKDNNIVKIGSRISIFYED